MKKFNLGLFGRILIAIVVGVALGAVFSHCGGAGDVMVRIFKTVNMLFSQLLKFIVPLLILGLVTPSIADVGKGAGAMLVTVMAVSYCSTVCAGFFGHACAGVLLPHYVPEGLLADVGKGNALRALWILGLDARSLASAVANPQAAARDFAAWTEAERRAAIRAGRWTPTRTDGDAEDGVVSFHLPSILALWVSPADLAVKFSRVKNDPVALQDFVNSDLAEPYVPADARIANTQLRAREGDYEHGRLRWPASDDVAIYGGVDVQQDHLVVVLRQFRVADAASALVWRGHLAAFAELDGLLSEYGAEACCVDARYRSDEVYEAALRYPGIWPTIGVAGFRVPAVFEQQSRNIDEGRRGASGRNVQVLIANSNALLDMLHARVAGADGAPSWEIPRGLASDPDYVGQLTAMYRNNGAWVNPRKLPEHYADAEKLAILAAWYAGIRPVGDAAPVADAGEVESEAQQ